MTLVARTAHAVRVRVVWIACAARLAAVSAVVEALGIVVHLVAILVRQPMVDAEGRVNRVALLLINAQRAEAVVRAFVVHGARVCGTRLAGPSRGRRGETKTSRERNLARRGRGRRQLRPLTSGRVRPGKCRFRRPRTASSSSCRRSPPRTRSGRSPARTQRSCWACTAPAGIASARIARP